MEFCNFIFKIPEKKQTILKRLMFWHKTSSYVVNALHVRDRPNVFVNLPSGDCIHWNGLEKDVLISGIVEKEDFLTYIYSKELGK